jgi:GT2 family glycosyltransferase
MTVVSAVVVNLDQREHVARCLESLAAALSRVDGTTEVVVVDNGSTDGSNELIRERFPGVRLIEQGRNTGFPPAAAEGVRATSGEWVLFLNNDATIEPDGVVRLLEAARGRGDVGSLAAQMRFAGGSSDRLNSAGIGVDRLGVAYDRLLGAPVSASETSVVEVFGASGGAALYRRAMLEDIGGIDETFFVYLEDVDVAWRARMRGWRCLYVPSAVVRHHHSVTTGHGSPFKHFHVGLNRVRMLAKNMTARQLLAWGLPIAAYDLAYVVYAVATDRTLAPLRGRWAGLKEWRRYRALPVTRDPSVLEPVRGVRAALARRRAWRESSGGVRR